MNTNAITLWQVQVEAGRPDLNMEKVREQINNTKKWGILVLPEMVVPGYFLWDDWLQDDYIKHCKEYNKEIIQLSSEKEITIVWWNIDFDEEKKNEDSSMRKYNASYLASNWELLKTQYKTLLPNYRMFDDKRYFTSLKDLASEENIDLEKYYKPVEVSIDWVKTKVSMLICEDIWNINGDYPIDPIEITKVYSPDLIVVPSASPFGLEKAKFRDKLLKIQSIWTTIAYVNPVGLQNNGKNIFNFDGGSSIYTDWKFVKWVEDYSESTTINSLKHKEENRQIFDALIYTIQMFWKQNWFTKASIGLSGWIDSGLVATLLTIALGKENVTAINMPSQFNGEITKNLAEQLANNLWIQYIVDSILESVDISMKRAQKNRDWKEISSFEIENIQARERWKTLSDNAPEFGPFTANGNKDELFTWYVTLYWDTSGALWVIADLTKSQVKDLSRWINENISPLIPNTMIEMKPSAELSDKQNVDNNWGDPFDYKILWAINKALIEKRQTVSDLVKMFKEWTLESFLWLQQWYLKKIFWKNPNPLTGISPSKEEDEFEEIIKTEFIKLARLKNNSFFKRVQYPPVPTISKASFGGDYRESQKQFYFPK